MPLGLLITTSPTRPILNPATATVLDLAAATARVHAAIGHEFGTSKAVTSDSWLRRPRDQRACRRVDRAEADATAPPSVRAEKRRQARREESHPPHRSASKSATPSRLVPTSATLEPSSGQRMAPTPRMAPRAHPSAHCQHSQPLECRFSLFPVLCMYAQSRPRGPLLTPKHHLQTPKHDPFPAESSQLEPSQAVSARLQHSDGGDYYHQLSW